MTKSVLLIVCLWLSAFAFVQAQEKIPQAISYQAVARDAAGKVLAGKNIAVKVEILKGSATGAAVYTETHGVKSTATGAVNLLIGQGNAGTGTFAGVDWATGSYFLKLSMDDKGGADYKVISTTQMLPVPYALYAEKAGTVENGGGGGSASGVNDFVLIPEDGDYDMLEILAGTNPTIENESFGFKIFILYLNGQDQQVELTVDGLPANSYSLEISPHSKNGRFLRLNSYYYEPEENMLTPGTYNVSYTFKNKDGVTKVFKATYIYKQ